MNDFLTENNLEQQIAEERKMILAKIEGKNEEILQKKETHRHKLNEVHEAYKREIQKENERHVDDLSMEVVGPAHAACKIAVEATEFVCKANSSIGSA